MSNIAILKIKNLASITYKFTIRPIKVLKPRHKVYLGIALFLFLLQFFMGGDTLFKFTDTNYILIFSLIGLLIAFIRRSKFGNTINYKSILSEIYSDYNLSSYTYSSLLSLIYSIFQGLILGTGFGFIFYAVGCLFYTSLGLFAINIAASFVCILLMISTRVIMEAITLTFSFAHDFSKKGG